MIWDPRDSVHPSEVWAKANGYKVSYKGYPRTWTGVLKQHGKPVWECGHRHDNRDSGNPRWGGSARGCAVNELDRRWRESEREAT